MTVAAANITLDLTLVKYEAPKEYQPLGRNLPKKHKDNAETGMIYVTARRLGALFEVVCPLTPRLVEAYGLRVSEILEALKGMDEAKNTIFADYAGIDGDLDCCNELHNGNTCSNLSMHACSNKWWR
jgi:hypothetical protein